MLAGRRPARLFTVLYFWDRAHFLTGGLLVFKCAEFSLGMSRNLLWGSRPKKAAHLDDLTER